MPEVRKRSSRGELRKQLKEEQKLRKAAEAKLMQALGKTEGEGDWNSLITEVVKAIEQSQKDKK
jgi:hypothetical protein